MREAAEEERSAAARRTATPAPPHRLRKTTHPPASVTRSVSARAVTAPTTRPGPHRTRRSAPAPPPQTTATTGRALLDLFPPAPASAPAAAPAPKRDGPRVSSPRRRSCRPSTRRCRISGFTASTRSRSSLLGSEVPLSQHVARPRRPGTAERDPPPRRPRHRHGRGGHRQDDVVPRGDRGARSPHADLVRGSIRSRRSTRC